MPHDSGTNIDCMRIPASSTYYPRRCPDHMAVSLNFEQHAHCLTALLKRRKEDKMKIVSPAMRSLPPSALQDDAHSVTHRLLNGLLPLIRILLSSPPMPTSSPIRTMASHQVPHSAKPAFLIAPITVAVCQRYYIPSADI